METFDSIVAGAGIWGCTVARRLAESGKRVLVLEKRPAIGGNCRCEIDPETGIEIHKRGSHIFHTSNEDVWKFVNRFAQFNGYRHCVLAKTKKAGRANRKTRDGFHSCHLPIGCTLLKEFFGREMKPSEMTESERVEIFDAFIRGYTSKQWGVPPEKVDPSIIARLKIRDNCSTDYFDDPYQGIPLDGYNAMFDRMLDHPNIVGRCNCPLRPEVLSVSARVNIYYSGPIDALFNYKFGALPWRTLRFAQETLDMADCQGNSVVNYTDADVPFTRIHEFKHYHPEWEKRAGGGSGPTKGGKTIIAREYSASWRLGDEPYYPVSTPESAALLKQYQEVVDQFDNSSCRASRPSLILGGRLGQYKYFDMDKAIEAALRVCVG